MTNYKLIDSYKPIQNDELNFNELIGLSQYMLFLDEGTNEKYVVLKFDTKILKLSNLEIEIVELASLNKPIIRSVYNLKDLIAENNELLLNNKFLVSDKCLKVEVNILSYKEDIQSDENPENKSELIHINEKEFTPPYILQIILIILFIVLMIFFAFFSHY